MVYVTNKINVYVMPVFLWIIYKIALYVKKDISYLKPNASHALRVVRHVKMANV
jgi:hypothetical protein